MVCLSVTTAFSEVAFLNSLTPIAHLEVSSRYVIRFRPPKCVYFDVPVCMPHEIGILSLVAYSLSSFGFDS